MTDYPITPPPELVQQWDEEAIELWAANDTPTSSHIATRAAQWGADQELAACCRQLTDPEWYDEIKNLRGPFRAAELRAARRPKPPSLKEQALDALALLCKGPDATAFVTCRDTIRRALEQLPDHE